MLDNLTKDSREFYATSGVAEGCWWSLWPPTLPSGDSISEASLVDDHKYGSTELIFPVASNGDISDITHILWGIFALTEKAKAIFESFSVRGLWFSPARSSNGVPLWIARAPLLTSAIDEVKSHVVREGSFPKGHPLEHRSGQIQSVSPVVLRRDIITGYDLFYLSEYPVFQVISSNLVHRIQSNQLSGLGINKFVDLRIA